MTRLLLLFDSGPTVLPDAQRRNLADCLIATRTDIDSLGERHQSRRFVPLRLLARPARRARSPGTLHGAPRLSRVLRVHSIERKIGPEPALRLVAGKRRER